jgi:hypothetical protein
MAFGTLNSILSTTLSITYTCCYAIVLMFANIIGLGELAFERWLVCRESILPNPCYTLARLIKR